MRLTRSIPVLLLLTGAIIGAAAASGQGPAPGKRPLTAEGRMAVSPSDRCPICGMKVAQYPKFAAAMQLTGGDTFYFCSTYCMALAWLHPDVHLHAAPAERARVTVIDYFTGTEEDGMAVTWVGGSDVVGPMGYTLIPLKTESHLTAFQARHGGRMVFRLSDLTDAMLGEIPKGPGARQP